MAKNEQLTSAIDLFGKSTDAIKRYLKYFAGLWALPFLYTVVTSFDKTAETLNDTGDVSNLGAKLILILVGVAVFIVAAVLIQSATVALELEAAQNSKITWKYLWEQTKHYALRLLGLGVVTGFIVFVGLILFIVPGVIFLRRYILAPYAMLDKDLNISEAMQRSAALTKPYSTSIYSVLVVSGLLGIVPSFFGAIGAIVSFILASLYSVAFAIRYEELKKLAK